MNVNTVSVEKWLESKLASGTQQLAGGTVVEQLAKLEAAKTGVGLVLLLEPRTSQEDEGVTSKTVLELESYPVFCFRGQWWTLVNQSMADVARAVIIEVTPTLQR